MVKAQQPNGCEHFNKTGNAADRLLFGYALVAKRETLESKHLCLLVSFGEDILNGLLAITHLLSPPKNSVLIAELAKLTLCNLLKHSLRLACHLRVVFHLLLVESNFFLDDFCRAVFLGN